MHPADYGAVLICMCTHTHAHTPWTLLLKNLCIGAHTMYNSTLIYLIVL